MKRIPKKGSPESIKLADQINNAPEPLKSYVMGIEQGDIPYLVQQVVCLEMQRDALLLKLKEPHDTTVQ